ncbi:phage protein [Streptococcus dysgalactiae]|uniref:hypothetical protein n=1 Tax=Streptococcus dysgalactiae TaxID=1334 RepID=UPI000E01C5DB|nr:hypothetical protein [Streptococcus dysgalactiae]SUN53739.1 phage protein [Streptococcus dysgalactiae]
MQFVQNLGSEPQEPKSGQFYYDSVANKLKIYNGSSWIVLDQQTADNIVNLINAGGSKIDKSKVDGLEEAINSSINDRASYCCGFKWRYRWHYC